MKKLIVAAIAILVFATAASVVTSCGTSSTGNLTIEGAGSAS